MNKHYDQTNRKKNSNNENNHEGYIAHVFKLMQVKVNVKVNRFFVPLLFSIFIITFFSIGPSNSFHSIIRFLNAFKAISSFLFSYFALSLSFYHFQCAVYMCICFIAFSVTSVCVSSIIIHYSDPYTLAHKIKNGKDLSK